MECESGGEALRFRVLLLRERYLKLESMLHGVLALDHSGILEMLLSVEGLPEDIERQIARAKAGAPWQFEFFYEGQKTPTIVLESGFKKGIAAFLVS